MLSLIVAVSENRVIGSAGTIPWRIPGEQKYFKEVTSGHAIVMGRKTFESIGKALPNRTNYVLTRSQTFEAPGCHVVQDPKQILEMCANEHVFVIGGAELYTIFLPHADRVYETLVHRNVDGDTYFPQLDLKEWTLIQSHDGPGDVVPHTFLVYERKGR